MTLKNGKKELELRTDSRVIKYNGSFIALASCSTLTSLEFNHSSRELNLFCPVRALRLSPHSKTLFIPIHHFASLWNRSLQLVPDEIFSARPSNLAIISRLVAIPRYYRSRVYRDEPSGQYISNINDKIYCTAHFSFTIIYFLWKI